MDNLDQVILDSKEKIDSEKKVEAKKKKGRPRKIPLNTSTERDSGVGVGLGVAQSEPSPSLEPLIATGLKLPFLIASKKTKCKDVKLDDDEAKPLAKQADLILREYMPQASETPASKASIFLFTLASVVISKAMILREHRKKEEASEKRQDEKEVKKSPPTNENPFETVSV